MHTRLKLKLKTKHREFLQSQECAWTGFHQMKTTTPSHVLLVLLVEATVALYAVAAMLVVAVPLAKASAAAVAAAAMVEVSTRPCVADRIAC